MAHRYVELSRGAKKKAREGESVRVYYGPICPQCLRIPSSDDLWLEGTVLSATQTDVWIRYKYLSTKGWYTRRTGGRPRYWQRCFPVNSPLWKRKEAPSSPIIALTTKQLNSRVMHQNHCNSRKRNAASKPFSWKREAKDELKIRGTRYSSKWQRRAKNTRKGKESVREANDLLRESITHSTSIDICYIKCSECAYKKPTDTPDVTQGEGAEDWRETWKEWRREMLENYLREDEEESGFSIL